MYVERPEIPDLSAPRFLRMLASAGITGPAMRWRNFQAVEYQDQLTRYYMDAAKVDRVSAGWKTIGAKPNDVWKSDAKTIRQRAMWLRYSNQYGARAVQTLIDAVIGTGIQTQCQISYSSDAEVNRRKNNAMEDRKKRWMEHAFMNPRMHFFDGQRLWLDSTITAGDCLIHRKYRRKNPVLPLVYEIIDRTRLTDLGTIPDNGNEVMGGVEYDQDGEKVAYHVEVGGYRYKVERIPANQIIHHYRVDRPGQQAGISWLAPVVPALFMLQDVLEYKMIQLKVQNAIAVLVSDNTAGSSRTPAPSVPTPIGQTKTDSSTGVKQEFIQEGMIHHVGKGSVSTLTPSPSHDMPELAKLCLRGIAVGIGLSYERLSGDFKEVSFAGGRLTENVQKDRVDSIHGWYCRGPEYRMHCDWTDAELAFGEAEAPRASADPYAVRFSLPRYRLGVNPLQEVRASIAAVDSALSSLPEEKEAMGGDWEATLENIIRSRNAGEAAGMKLYKALFGDDNG